MGFFVVRFLEFLCERDLEGLNYILVFFKIFWVKGFC